MAADQRLGYRPGLDGLRGLAVVLVMAAHARVPLMGNGGAVGVTLFFVLSGYLITTLLVEEGRIDLAAFYLRRARRLFPALAAVILAAVAAGMATAHLWSVVFYVGNWMRADGESLGVLNHTWSLAIEEQFYLAWPLVLIVFGRRALPIAVVGVVATVALRTWMWQDSSDSVAVYFSTFTRADAILAGCVLGFTQWRSQVTGLAVAVLVALSALTVDWVVYDVGFTVAMVVSVVAVSSAVDRPGWLTMPVLVWFGKRSYGLYLWHTMMTFHFGPVGWVETTAVLALSLAVVELSWRMVERPVMRWRRVQFRPSRKFAAMNAHRS